MFQLGLSLLSLFWSFSSAVPANIEKAFLRNNPGILFEMFSSREPVSISLPEPISFSDQISAEQAFFLFRKIFETYTTFEFFPETSGFRPVGPGRYILKARWSFLNKNRNQNVFHVYFYIRAEKAGSSSRGPWRIAEIKAERL